MSDKQNFAQQSDSKKKKKRNKNKNKKKNKGGQQQMDIQFSVDVPATDDTNEGASAVDEVLHEISSKQDEETLVVDVAENEDEQGTKVSTTETVMESNETFDVNELPEDVRQDLLKGMSSSNVTVVIDGKEVELPPGVTPESLSEDDIAKLLPVGESVADGGNTRVIEVTETIVTEGDEYEQGDTTEVVITTEELDAGDVEEHSIHLHKDQRHHHHDDRHEDVVEEKKYTIEGVVTGFQPHVTEEISEKVSENDNVKTVEVTKVKKTMTASSEDVPVSAEGLDTNVIIDVQTSPWKVDTDVEEIVHHNKRVRMTKITKSRKVIVTKTADGEEVETVVEEEDEDENPEVIGEIGEFDDTHNETIEIQKIIKKRRVIVTKTADGQEIETVIEDDESPVKITGFTSSNEIPEADRHVEKTTFVKTRRVIITQNEFGEDVETIIDDDKLEPVNFKGRISETEDVIETIETQDVEAEPFQDGDLATDSVVSVNQIEPRDESVTTHHHYIVHKEVDDDGMVARVKDVTHEDEDKVELTVEIVAGNDDNNDDDSIKEATEANMVESEVDFDALFGPPDEQHLQALKEQQNIAAETADHEHLDHEHEETEEYVPSNEDKELIEENEIHLQQHTNDDNIGELDLKKLEDATNKPTKTKVNSPVNITITLNVPGESKPRVSQKLTAEQRKMLEDIEMPKIKSVLDDWVLVNFTPEEVTRFAELVRYQPGWLDQSVEIQKCCKLM